MILIFYVPEQANGQGLYDFHRNRSYFAVPGLYNFFYFFLRNIVPVRWLSEAHFMSKSLNLL